MTPSHKTWWPNDVTKGVVLLPRPDCVRSLLSIGAADCRYCAAARILGGLRNFVSFPFQTIIADLCLSRDFAFALLRRKFVTARFFAR